MRQILRFVIPAGIILALLAPGCYTVLMHPSDEGDHHASQTSNCLSCHNDYQEYPYGYYYAPTPSFWWNYPRYGYYYATPWWWGYYDYSYLDGRYRYEAPDLEGTKFGRRELNREPILPPHAYEDTPVPPRPYPQNPNPIAPGIWDIPGDYTFDVTPGTSTSRSRTDNNADTGQQVETAPEPTRPSRPAYNDTKQENTQQNNQPAPKPKEDSTKTKKKDRRGRGGS